MITMKYTLTFFTGIIAGIFLIPTISYAATCTRTYDFNLNGYSANGTIRTVNDTAYGSFTVFDYPYGSPTTLYDVYIETEGEDEDINSKCFTEEEMDIASTWAFNQGVGLFFAQDDGSSWVHDLTASCGNTHTFTRTVASSQPAGPSGGDPICDAGFHVINRSQNRAAHQAECQALGSGWDLAEVTSNNAGAINNKITGFTVVANRVVNSSDFEYEYKCGIETTWPEPLKTLIYDGSCFADIPDSNLYSKALCVDSTPLCNTTDGVCSSSQDTCTTGTFRDLNDSATEYKWQCLGIDEGADSPVCTAPILIDGICGTTVDTCAPGTVINTPSDTPSQHRWSCQGFGGGDTDVCSINKDDANAGGNNGQGSFDPYCTVTPRVAEINTPIVWNIVTGTNNEVAVGFDWVSAAFSWADSKTEQSFSYESDTALSISSTGISTLVTRSNDPRDVSCAAARFIEEMIISVDQPIVEPTEQCRLNWSKVDTSGACTLTNQQGGTSYSITAASGFRDVEPRQSNDKYYIECIFRDELGVEIETVVSEYVSCIKKGVLIEI